MRRNPYQGPTLNPIWAIIGVNLLVFIFTLIKPSETYTMLGLTPAYVLQQPWTIITSMFVHAGIWHILANMFTFYFFGTYLLSMVNNWKFLLVYFGGGILGGIAYILLAPLTANIFAPAVGASGAVFSIGGALAVMVPNTKVFILPLPVPIPLWVAVLLGFVIISPGVAWQAHLGGLVFGLVAGYFFRRQQFRRVRW